MQKAMPQLAKTLEAMCPLSSWAFADQARGQTVTRKGSELFLLLHRPAAPR